MAEAGKFIGLTGSWVPGCQCYSRHSVFAYWEYFNLQCYIEKFVQLIIPLEDRLLFG